MQVSLPSVTFNILAAKPTIDNTQPRCLIVGQMLASGNATAGALTTNVGNNGEESALFGKASHIANIVRNFRRLNPATPVDCLAYADIGGGTAASGTIAITGPATASGSLTIRVGSAVDGTFTVAVAASDTATAIGANIATAINANSLIPFTANSVTGTVTITSAHKGTIHNKSMLEVLGSASVGITSVITGFASGASDPVTTGIAAVIANVRYNSIVFPGTWSRTSLNTEMKLRLNETNIILDGMAIVTITDTKANLISNVASDNNPLLIAFANPLIATSVFAGGALKELNDNISGQFAAIRCLRLTSGSNLTNFVSRSVAPKDVFGGPHIASLPYFNTPMINMTPSYKGVGYSAQDMLDLKAAGLSIIANNTADNAVLLGEVMTTYMTDSTGAADPSFSFANYVDTISQVREYIVNNLKAQYAQSRLSMGSTTPGFSMATQASIAASIMGYYVDMSAIALTPNDAASLAFTKANILVSLNLATGTANVSMQCPIIVQLRVIIATIQMAFNTQSAPTL